MSFKAVLIAIAGLILIGAGLYLNSGVFNKKLAEIKGFSRECVDGVQYLQFPSGVTVKYNVDGKIATCN